MVPLAHASLPLKRHLNQFGSRSNHQHANLLHVHFAESEVISPANQITLLSDLLMTACDAFPTTFDHPTP